MPERAELGDHTIAGGRREALRRKRKPKNEALRMLKSGRGKEGLTSIINSNTQEMAAAATTENGQAKL